MRGPRYSITPTDALHDRRVTDLHLRILAILGSHSDQNGWLIINQKKIASVAGCTRETVNRRIKDLVEWGYVRSRGRVGEDGRRLVNHYQVILDREPIENASEPPVTSGDHRGCDLQDVTGGVTPEDHKGCDLQGSQQGNDLYSERSKKGKLEASIREELQKSLDCERTHDVIEHLAAIGKPLLTSTAARLLAREFQKFGDANAAAELMILNGWTRFNNELVKRGGQGATDANPSKPKSRSSRTKSSQRLWENLAAGGENVVETAE